MIKKINIEEIKKREEFLYGKLLTRKEVEYALEEAKASVKRNMAVSYTHLTLPTTERV